MFTLFAPEEDTTRGSGGEPFVRDSSRPSPAFSCRVRFSTRHCGCFAARAAQGARHSEELGRGGADGLAHVRLVRLRMVFGGGGRGLRHVDIHDLLCVWLTVRWAMMPDGPRASRQLVLIAYMFGLSLGVHQLNLLCIPALAMIFAIRRGIRESRQSNPYISAVAGGGRLHSCRRDAMVDSAGGMAGADGSERRGTAGAVGGRAVYSSAGRDADCLAAGYSKIVPHAPPQSRALDAGDASHGIFLLRSDSCAGRDSLAGQRLAARQSFLVRGVSGPRAVRQQTASIRPHALQQGDV